MSDRKVYFGFTWHGRAPGNRQRRNAGETRARKLLNEFGKPARISETNLIKPRGLVDGMFDDRLMKVSEGETVECKCFDT